MNAVPAKNVHDVVVVSAHVYAVHSATSSRGAQPFGATNPPTLAARIMLRSTRLDRCDSRRFIVAPATANKCRPVQDDTCRGCLRSPTFSIYFLNLRRNMGTRPNRPVPRSAIELGSGVLVIGVKLKLSKIKAWLLSALTVTDVNDVASVNAANTGGVVCGAANPTEPLPSCKKMLALDTTFKPKKLIGCEKVKVRALQLKSKQLLSKLATWKPSPKNAAK